MPLNDMPFTLSSAATSFNVLQILGGSRDAGGHDANGGAHPFGFLINLITALFVAGVAKYFYHFMNETWPSWVRQWMDQLLGSTKEMPRTNAAASDHFKGQPDELAFENELLITSIERYVAHILEISNPFPHTENEEALSQHENNPERTVRSMTSEEEAAHMRRASRKQKFMRQGAYCYKPVNDRMVCHRSCDLGTFLKRHYRITLTQAEDDSVEVEPGLFVRIYHEYVQKGKVQGRRPISCFGDDFLGKDFIPLNFDKVMPSYEKTFNRVKQPLDTKKNRNAGGNDNCEDDENGYEDDYEDDDYLEKAPTRVLVRRALLTCTYSEDDASCHRDNRELCTKLRRERMVSFVTRAYNWYLGTAVKPAERYFFYPVSSQMRQAVSSVFQEMDFDDFKGQMTVRLVMRRLPILSDRSSFDMLFFRQKDELVQLLSDFKHSQGKFASLSDGYSAVPRQLVILLHGPPGTGKTTTVRCITAMLQRHIVSVPIDCIQSNSALYGLLRGGGVVLRGEMRTTHDVDCDGFDLDPVLFDLKTEEVAYVFEDVDAVSAMATFRLSSHERRRVQYKLRRNLCSSEESGHQDDSDDTDSSVAKNTDINVNAIRAATADSPVQDKIEADETVTVKQDSITHLTDRKKPPEVETEGVWNTSNDANSVEEKESEEKSKGNDNDNKDHTNSDPSQGSNAKNDDMPGENSSEVSSSTLWTDGEGGSEYEEYDEDWSYTEYADDEFGDLNYYAKLFVSLLGKDALSPDGFLRALDKNFGPPGRVVILTTNHPERLPKEFFRPGFVTLTVKMDVLDCEMALQLLEHYYPDAFTAELRKRFAELFTKEVERCASLGGKRDNNLCIASPAVLESFAQTCDTLEELFSALQAHSEMW